MKKKTKSKSTLVLINLKVSPTDKKRLSAAARKYAKGNLSAWLRHAGIALKPAQNKTI